MSKSSVLESRAIDVMQRGAGRVSPLGVSVVPSGPVGLHVGPSEWLVLAAEDDPQLRDAKLALPDAVAAHLEALTRSKVSFDRLFVAHELPAGTLDRAAKTKLGPGDLDRIVPPPTPHPRTLATLAACSRVAELAGAALTLPVKAAGAALAALDPALIGVVTASGHADPAELGVWFLLAAWT